jgi:hypothetical protein
VLRDRFVDPLTLKRATAARHPDELSRLGISAAVVYDALVAPAAVEHGTDPAPRDPRCDTDIRGRRSSSGHRRLVRRMTEPPIASVRHARGLEALGERNFDAARAVKPTTEKPATPELTRGRTVPRQDVYIQNRSFLGCAGT